MGLDQRISVITWTFPDKTAAAPAQILASWSPSSSSWRWTWANESILPEMSHDARAVRDGPRPTAAMLSRLWLSGSQASIADPAQGRSRSSRSDRSP
ncbi:DUF6882 domain-containing protein [Kitasatospora humi]|uniref:DUF6882 domain-containing protein n=1 Tax=Kitasatospora humi TaxID=2893891 RepID=UPI003557707E